MTLLLDTNAYAEFKRGASAVRELVHRARLIRFSTVVAGELIAGFRHGSRTRRNLEELRMFIDHPRVRVAPVTRVTADRYGRIYAALRAAGTPIPTNDMWVAAHAMETGADLLSGDAHFARVAGLAWVDLSDL